MRRKRRTSALGQRIGWAVLDTGIAAGHPHFHEKGKRDVVVAQWDCTRRGKPKKLLRADGSRLQQAGSQRPRHARGGSHRGPVQCASPWRGNKEKTAFSGMAPQAQLYGFKVLDDDGNGRDSWIIKAVQQVADINDDAGELVIHGVNLSVGGYFDAESYGCGFTPLCNELRRLWRQGVVVVLAAGNEGLAWLVQNDGEPYPANMDMTIGDPANLEDAIAVGSVHKGNPHSYGVSYFSSRGPTADGRHKPDVVAPGEKIISAHYDFKEIRPQDLDGGNERHQHGRAACVGIDCRIPVGAPRVHRLSRPGEADRAGATAPTSAATPTCRARAFPT